MIVLAELAGLIRGLIFSLILVKSLGIEAFGQYAASFSLIRLAAGIAALKLSDYHLSKGLYRTNYSILEIGSFMIQLLIGVAFLYSWKHLLAKDLDLFLLMCPMIFWSAKGLFDTFYVSIEKQFLLYSRNLIFELTFLSAGIFAFFCNYHWHTLINIYGFLLLIVCLADGLYFKNKIRLTMLLEISDFKKFVSYQFFGFTNSTSRTVKDYALMPIFDVISPNITGLIALSNIILVPTRLSITPLLKLIRPRLIHLLTKGFLRDYKVKVSMLRRNISKRLIIGILGSITTCYVYVYVILDVYDFRLIWILLISLLAIIINSLVVLERGIFTICYSQKKDSILSLCQLALLLVFTLHSNFNILNIFAFFILGTEVIAILYLMLIRKQVYDHFSSSRSF